MRVLEPRISTSQLESVHVWGTAGHSLPVLAAHLLEVIFRIVNLGEWRERNQRRKGEEKEGR